MSKLPRPKNCPFCGERSFKLNQDMLCGEWFVQCKKCLGMGPLKPDPTRAINAWNTRPGEQKALATITQATLGAGR